MKLQSRTGFAAFPGRGSARQRRRLPALLLAVPICTFANTPAAPRLATLSEHSAGTNIPGELVAPAVGSPSRPFILAAPDSSTPLADSDDRDRRAEQRRGYQGGRGQADNRGNEAERRSRIEDRRRRFEAMSPNQQRRLIQTRERFLNLPPETRERLRQRWQDMSPDERRRWRESESHRN